MQLTQKKHYCYKCGQPNNPTALVCKKCGEEIILDLDPAQVKSLTQATHKRENVARDKRNAGLTALVIGSILVIIGILFFFLSIDNTQRPPVISPQRMEFWVFLVFTIVGSLAIIYAVTFIVWSIVMLKDAKRVVSEIRSLS